MKAFILISLSLFLFIHTYDRNAVVSYAKTYWNTVNHKCGSGYHKCTPYSYFGGEHCGYGSHGGDCANFVSQCVLAGGHPRLKGGACRGYPCGVEEVGASKLSNCLRDHFHWESNCGYKIHRQIFRKEMCWSTMREAAVILHHMRLLWLKEVQMRR